MLLLHLEMVPSIPVPEVVGSQGVLLRTVPWGTNVVLRCMSNDENHNFQYWHLVNKGLIIGPANQYDLAKFKFEILSGNLTIRVSFVSPACFYKYFFSVFTRRCVLDVVFLIVHFARAFNFVTNLFLTQTKQL